MALLGLFVVTQPVAATWTEAPATPLTGTQPTFLNGSSVAQRKTGSFIIGSLSRTSKLCLNPDHNFSIQHAANTTRCIDAWGDLATVSGPFVRRQELVNPSPATNPAVYGTADEGFAAVTALGSNNQYISTVVKPNPAATTPTKYAVYASDSGIQTRYAAQLSGTSVIDNAAHDAKLCLNGQCITRWADVGLYAANSVIRIQNSTYLQTDNGNASVSGVLWLQRGLNLGRPHSSTSPLLTSVDGQCTEENGETVANSPLDCI